MNRSTLGLCLVVVLATLVSPVTAPYAAEDDSPGARAYLEFRR